MCGHSRGHVFFQKRLWRHLGCPFCFRISSTFWGQQIESPWVGWKTCYAPILAPIKLFMGKLNLCSDLWLHLETVIWKEFLTRSDFPGLWKVSVWGPLVTLSQRSKCIFLVSFSCSKQDDTWPGRHLLQLLALIFCSGTVQSSEEGEGKLDETNESAPSREETISWLSSNSHTFFCILLSLSTQYLGIRKMPT